MSNLAAALAVVLMFSGLLFGQSEAGHAAIEGIVFDPSRRAIPSVDILVIDTQTARKRKTVSNAEGAFRIAALPVGAYDVEASAPGFAGVKVSGVSLSVGETRDIKITLQVASVSSQVTVVEDPPGLDQSDPASSETLDQRAVEDLPIRGRNFTDFIQLTPNVIQEQNRYGMVVNGQRSINANISVDGVDFNDPLQGGQRGGGANESQYFFPQLAIREFQVVANGVSAEVGRTTSGYVNVVTKSGTNTYHGEGFYANRNAAMTSPDAFNNPTNNNSQHQFGGSMGGPIMRDKLFFFGAAEKNLLTIPYTVKFLRPSGNVIVPQDILNQQGTFAGKNNPLVAFGRLDYQLSEKSSFNLQYTYAAQNGLNFNGPTGQTTAAVTNNLILDRASQGIKAGFTRVLSPRLLNEVRGQWVYDNRIKQPNSPLPEVTINDFGTLGGSKAGTEIYNATRYEILDNISWSRGIHNFKFGVDFNVSPEQQQREANYAGLYSFATLADYLAAVAGDKSKIQQYQQSIAANGTQGLYVGKQQDHGVFVVDTIKARRDLTITAGLRWDVQINPQPTTPNPKYALTAHIPSDLRMWQPRLGLAYSVKGKDKTVLRLSAGLFDARTPAYLMQRVFTDNGLNTLVLDTSVDPTILSFLVVPNRINALPPGVKTPINSIYAFDPAFRNPRSGQVAAAVQQQIGRNTTATIGFVRNSTWDLQRRLDQNLFPPTMLPNGFVAYPAFDSKGVLVQASGYNDTVPAVGQLGQGIYIDSATGRPFAPRVARPDPTIGAINVNMSVGHSTYNGGYIAIQHRMSRRLQFAFNYTYSVNRDDDSNERDFNRQTAYDTYNLRIDAGYAKNDVRHNGNMNVLYDLGRGFTISTLLMARTGIPVRAVLGTDLQNDGNSVNDMPVLNGVLVKRNAFRQPGFFDWDLRLLKQFKISERVRVDLSAEGFNLTRASNKQFNADGESTFGKPQSTRNPNTGLFFTNNTALIPTFSPGTDRLGGARQGQLGVRFIF